MKYLILILLLTSCGTAHKLRKADKLINQAIAQGAKVRVDTVFVDKILPGKSTTVDVHHYHDTTIVQDNIKLQWRMVHDTVRLTVDCPPDTIRVPVTIHKSIICPDCPKDRFWKGVGWGAGGIIILLIILGLVRLIK